MDIKLRQIKLMENRFWPRINKNGPVHPVLKTHCWEWTGGLVKGYGVIGIHKSRKIMYCHRYIWALTTGKIPKLNVLHKCDNPKCANPKHLFLGTDQDNKNDCITKDRHNRGSRNGKAKLTDASVLKIRKIHADCTLNNSEIATMFGVNRQAISKIVNRKRWTHI